MSTLSVDTIQGKTTAGTVAMPAGATIQVVDSGAKTTSVTVQSTTFTDTNMVSVAITPKFATSKIYVVVTQNIQVWNNANYATGRWRILRNINGGSGINVYSPMTYQLLDTPNTTNEVIYKTQIAQGSHGGNRIVSDGENPGRMTLLEISG